MEADYNLCYKELKSNAVAQTIKGRHGRRKCEMAAEPGSADPRADLVPERSKLHPRFPVSFLRTPPPAPIYRGGERQLPHCSPV
jgi:hypothetical protein